ncbi:hypothetical protein [Pontibaca methylaminivorans]|uniref:Uncharacterized protein n=1 Tax=Pontibaca methylaminivorans TaxID=515897 RepID=A0A1R3WCU4_9RHOB|nr:hypothetical protein [Pontibaca methylaminivorans]SIT74884.1 hypothetical protein SAMN05421849_0228 [Pontibaca methylaminivorans]
MNHSQTPAPWRKIVEEKDWSSLDAYWRYARQGEAADILAALRRAVGTTKIVNGVEHDIIDREPAEVPADLVGAAEILREGELEAYAMGEDVYLQPYREQWAELSGQVLKDCRELEALPEVTEGDASMSRQLHARVARGELAWINRILAAMLVADDDDPNDDPALDAALQEHMATVAVKAFIAGQHFRAALGKVHEVDAIRGEINLEAAEHGGEVTSLLNKDNRERIMARMIDLIRNEGLNVTSAAWACAAEGLASQSAVRSTWYRHRKTVATPPLPQT